MPNSRARVSLQKTINDVALRAGVSISTVSRVLNQSAPVSPELEEKVRQVIADMDYRPQTAARTLAGRKTFTIGLVLAKIGTDYYPLMIDSIEAEARRNDYNLLISVAGENLSEQDEMPCALGPHNTDGLLVFPDSLSRNEIIHLHQNNFPVVLVQHSPPDDLNLPYINIENQISSRNIVDHLIEVHGLKRIAFLAGLTEHEDAALREQGYLDSLKSHNIAFDPDLRSLGYFQKKESQEAVNDWLARGIEFDAIFASDDISAIGALSALNQAGLRVPEDVAVVGFDDVEISRYLSPPLTTVSIPIQEVGLTAITELLKLIQTGTAEPFIELKTELVIRRSCGCSY
ncbi:MAG: LacI family DNA-binding transcriptional regulator [Anaerolineaceae bacterium]|nr:LacI family DNA-binding transcriptional regulator [Anaerolineaceae bacterium]